MMNLVSRIETCVPACNRIAVLFGVLAVEIKSKFEYLVTPNVGYDTCEVAKAAILAAYGSKEVFRLAGGKCYISGREFDPFGKAEPVKWERLEGEFPDTLLNRGDGISRLAGFLLRAGGGTELVSTAKRLVLPRFSDAEGWNEFRDSIRVFNQTQASFRIWTSDPSAETGTLWFERAVGK